MGPVRADHVIATRDEDATRPYIEQSLGLVRIPRDGDDLRADPIRSLDRGDADRAGRCRENDGVAGRATVRPRSTRRKRTSPRSRSMLRPPR